MSIYLENDAATTVLDMLASGRVHQAAGFLKQLQAEQEAVLAKYPTAVDSARNGIAGLDHVVVDDDATVIPVDGGAWVSAWVHLDDGDMES